MDTKRCSKCGETKLFSEFHKRRDRPDGLSTHCKSCRIKDASAYLEANREKVLARRKAYREANREKLRAIQNAYHKANREKVCTQQRAYLKANREKVRAQQRAHYKANREKMRTRHRAYEEASRDNCKPSYVAKVLGMRAADIPPELVQVKAAHLKLLREVKRKLESEEC